VLLTTLLVIAIAIGLQMVGVVLMSAMVVAPGAAARQWTDRLGLMVILAAGFGALAGVSGATLSGEVARLPTGPTIVVGVSLIVLVSLLLAPNRGVLWNALEERSARRRLRGEAVLADLAELEAQHAGQVRGHAAAVLQTMNPGRAVRPTLDELAGRGLVRRTAKDEWLLTDAGRDAADRAGRHRPAAGTRAGHAHDHDAD
jgi:manganese/zinc/iron transport system permease protein